MSDSTTIHHISNCKQCGSEARVHEQKMLPTEDHAAEYIITCTCCIHRGEWRLTEFEAIQVWNSKNRSIRSS